MPKNGKKWNLAVDFSDAQFKHPDFDEFLLIENFKMVIEII